MIFIQFLFFSHKLNRETVKLTQLIKPEIIVCQSAISTAAFDDLHESGCTVFGFVEKINLIATQIFTFN